MRLLRQHTLPQAVGQQAHVMNVPSCNMVSTASTGVVQDHVQHSAACSVGGCSTSWQVSQCQGFACASAPCRAWADEWRPAPIEVDYNPHWPRSTRQATPVAAPADARAFDAAQAAAAAQPPGGAPNVPGSARRAPASNRAAVYALNHHQSQQQQQQQQRQQGPLTASRSRLGHADFMGSGMAPPPDAGDSAGTTPSLSTWGSGTREDRLTLDTTPWEHQGAAAPSAGAPLDARRHPPLPPGGAAVPAAAVAPPGPPQLYAPMSPGAGGAAPVRTSSGGGVARLQDIELAEGHHA